MVYLQWRLQRWFIYFTTYRWQKFERKRNVVVVSLNHRLNVLGLDLSAYGDKYKYSGNVGIADIVAALRWIIDKFGGNPDNITIFDDLGVQSSYADGYSRGRWVIS